MVRAAYLAPAAAKLALIAVLKAAASREKSALLAASAVFTSEEILMPFDGSLSSSNNCRASKRLTTLESLTSVTPASCSGVMVAAQGALPSATPPMLKLTVSPA